MDELISAKLSTLKIERAISGLTEWQKHVQTDSDIDRDISVAVKVLKAQLGTNLAEVGTNCSEFPNNSDAISRQAAIDTIEDFPHGDVWNVESMEEMVDRIKQLPSAQPKMGRWIEYEQEFMLEGSLGTVQKTVRECSVCTAKIAGMVGIMNFCPNCGADMRGEQDE